MAKHVLFWHCFIWMHPLLQIDLYIVFANYKLRFTSKYKLCILKNPSIQIRDEVFDKNQLKSCFGKECNSPHLFDWVSSSTRHRRKGARQNPTLHGNSANKLLLQVNRRGQNMQFLRFFCQKCTCCVSCLVIKRGNNNRITWSEIIVCGDPWTMDCYQCAEICTHMIKTVQLFFVLLWAHHPPLVNLMSIRHVRSSLFH